MMIGTAFSSISSTKISLQISEALAIKGKPFTDGELIKECIQIFTKIVCPEKTDMANALSLSHQTVARRMIDLSENISNALVEKLNKCQVYSLALDESTDISDTAQLTIFVRGVTQEFEVIEEMLDLCHMKGTTTGQNIFNEVINVMNKFKLQEDRLCSLTTDGAPALTGKNTGFVTLMKKHINSELVNFHCIIHQEQLCAKQLQMNM